MGAILIMLALTARVGIPRAQKNYQPYEMNENPLALTRSDPSIGSSMGHINKPTILVVLGDCTSCNIGKIRQLDSVPGLQSQRCVLFLKKIDSDVDNAIAQSQHTLLLRSLTAAELTSLNASFTPRVYGFDSASHLIYIQSPMEAWTQAVLVADGRLHGKK